MFFSEGVGVVDSSTLFTLVVLSCIIMFPVEWDRVSVSNGIAPSFFSGIGVSVSSGIGFAGILKDLRMFFISPR